MHGDCPNKPINKTTRTQSVRLSVSHGLLIAFPWNGYRFPVECAVIVKDVSKSHLRRNKMQMDRGRWAAIRIWMTIGTGTMLAPSGAILGDESKDRIHAFKPGLVLWAKTGCFGSNIGLREGLRKGDRVISVHSSPVGLVVTGFAKALDVTEHGSICYTSTSRDIAIYDHVLVVSSDRSIASLSRGELTDLSK